MHRLPSSLLTKIAHLEGKPYCTKHKRYKKFTREGEPYCPTCYWERKQ